MGSLISKNKQEEMETPEKQNIFKRIEDPRSPTEEINRTPVEVFDKIPKDDFLHLAYSNALKQQNSAYAESSPIFRKMENSERNVKKSKYSFAKALESTPILDAEESNLSLDVSAIEKENVH